MRKNPSNVLSSRLLPPQLVPPSDTPTLSAPHMGTSVEGKNRRGVEEQRGFSRQTLQTEARHRFSPFFFCLSGTVEKKKKKECEGNEKYVQIVTLVMGLAFPA